MMHYKLLPWSFPAIGLLWLLWVLVWIVAARRSKPIAQRQSLRSRFLYRALAVASIILLALGKKTRLGAILAAAPATSWLYERFVGFYPDLVLTGAVLVALGLGVAIWARFYLGGNWSSSVTFKRDHELIRSGPYRYVRHPIYTGILIAVAGTACAIGQWRALLGFVLIFIALSYKSRQEERLMIEHFGDAYHRYRQQVKSLIPYLF